MIILPTLYYLSTSQSLLLDEVSIPEVGSSNMINLEFPIKAIPTDNFLFYPPEAPRLDISLLVHYFRSKPHKQYMASLRHTVSRLQALPMHVAPWEPVMGYEAETRPGLHPPTHRPGS